MSVNKTPQYVIQDSATCDKKGWVMRNNLRVAFIILFISMLVIWCMYHYNLYIDTNT